MTSSRQTGIRGSAAVLLPTAAVGLTFGLIATPVLGPWASVLLSALVWSGTAQLGAVSVLGAGGGVGLAAATGLVANTRYVPMGFALAPSLARGRLRGAAVAAVLADASFAIAHRRQGGFDPATLVWAWPLQYAGWVGGTALGVAGAAFATAPERLGLDVLVGVFYLTLLLPELRGSSRALLAAGVAGLITVCSVPFVPQGLPVLLACLAALVGLLPERTREDR